MTGTAGIGKTRLAIDVAHTLLKRFSERRVIRASRLPTGRRLVLPSIAQALGLKEGGDRPLLESLKTFLRDIEVLMVLDNFEQ